MHVDKQSLSDELRQVAEKKLGEQQSNKPASEAAVLKPLHEMQVNRIELELVNEELSLSEHRARQAIEACNAAIWDYDLTTGEVYLSEAWSSFLHGRKYPTHTTIHDLVELVPEEERQTVFDAIMQAAGKEGPSEYRLNHRVRKPDGKIIWVHSRGRVVHRDGQGRALHMIGVIFDITKRFEAEEKLIESEQRFRALFESAGEYAMVLQLQESGPPIIVDGNRAFFKKHGYTRKELVGQPITMLLTPASAKQAAVRVRQIKTGRTVTLDVEHRCKDGSIFIAEAMARKVAINGGDLVYSVARDTTERHRAEQEEQRLLAENRLLLLQLIQIQEDERRSLARDLHDELGQMLTSIDIQSQYITKHASDTDLKEAAERITRDVQAIFTSSRAELSRLRPATLDILGLEAALTDLTNNVTHNNGVHCKLLIEGNIDQLSDIYAITIYRLVQEALTNCQRHGKADRADVVIKHVPAQAGRAGGITIEIRDNGHGFSEEKLYKGLGTIGMRERVKALGGTFELTHVPGDGVCIKAMLPLPDASKGAK